ncbi:MAG: pantothenate kinase [SAR86 cluster bacterium]|uniref:Pantothenate kinase n=1 Tax=SAR86 cluster bacterium TaxID=2030880 RepID=A0A937SAS8_9GAMM|nr:pantothenate kinase [SAR86 cluster bacterium]
MIAAFDFGITNTDLVIKDQRIKFLSVPSPFDRKNRDFDITERHVIEILEKLDINIKEISSIGVTGGKSADLPDRICDVPVTKINEIDAIGKGARSLYKISEESSLVVSSGTGTACVHIQNTATNHLGGISVGGGMLEGLSKLLVDNPYGIEINNFAEKGNRKILDVMIGEAVNEIGNLNAEITAANFAKARNEPTNSIEDISASLCNMVGEVIGTVVYLNALLVGSNKAYFLGRTSMLSEVKKGIDARLALAGIEGIYDENRAFGNAIGVLDTIDI